MRPDARQLFGNLLRGATSRIPARGEAYPFKLKDQPATERSIEQGAQDYASIIGSLLGLGLEPGGREEMTQAYYPYVHTLMRGLSSLGLDPYSKWRKDLLKALDVSTIGRPSSEQYNRVAQAMGSYMSSSRGGLSSAAAGFRPAQQARVLKQLAASGLVPNLARDPYGSAQFLSSVLQSLAAIEEATRQPADVGTLERLIGPLSVWKRYPGHLEAAVRSRLMSMGELT